MDELMRQRRWQLALGAELEQAPLNGSDKRLNEALSALYGDGKHSEARRGGLGGSAPRVARWLGDIREFFPASVVQLVQRDAFERLGLKQMLMEPEFLQAMEADVHLVADLVSLGGMMPAQTMETARQVIRKVVDELLARLEQKTAELFVVPWIKANAVFVPVMPTSTGTEPSVPIYATTNLSLAL